MISGGDLPADHNGITLFGWGGVPLLPEDEAAIEAQIEQLAGDRASRRSTPFKRYSLLPASDVHDKYLSRLTAWAAPDALNGLRVVVDGGFGTAHKLAPDALTQVGASVISLNDAPDGTNIALNAGAGHVQHDPSSLLAAIHEHHADVGLAFDALGERAVFVTPEGALLTGEHVTGILALEMQAAGSLPFDSVVASEDGHAVLAARLMAHGVQVVAAPPGLRSLLATMHAQGLRLGATGNGSVIVLNDDHTYADGLYVALLILWLVAQDKQHGGPTLHQRAAPFSA
jgi:phosphoglucosamine mutase